LTKECERLKTDLAFKENENRNHSITTKSQVSKEEKPFGGMLNGFDDLVKSERQNFNRRPNVEKHNSSNDLFSIMFTPMRNPVRLLSSL